MTPQRRYNPVVALVLAIILGFLGIDRFYTGNVFAGVIKLLTLGGFGFWWIIDIVIFAVQVAQKSGQAREAQLGGAHVDPHPAGSTEGGPAADSVGPREAAARPAAHAGSQRRGRAEPQHEPPSPRGEGIRAWSRTGTMTEVVGEYYRPEAYEKIFEGMPRDGTFSNFERTAALYPDPHNPHSSGTAVAVWIDGHHAGFLAGGNSGRYSPLLKSMAEHGQYLIMRSRITGRFDQRKKRWIAETGLELPEPDQILPVNTMPSGEYVLIPAGRTIQVTEEGRHMDVLGPLTGDGPIAYAATLHAIHEVRPRSSYETVEVRINGDAVGALSKTTAEKVLPLVQLIEGRGLIAVARAKVSGNSLSAEVTLNMIRSADADPAWISEIEKRPLVPRTAEGPGGDESWNS